jgi:hypothetical protein
MTSQPAPPDAVTTDPLVRARFTPVGTRNFYRLAAPNPQAGLWSGVRRRSASTFDRFEILLSGVGYTRP